MIDKPQLVKNQYGLNMVVRVFEPETADIYGLVVMVHGLSSSSNRPIFTATTETFLAAGYRVVRYDASHSITAASDGDPGQCTTTSLFEDLCDIMNWLEQQELTEDKLILMGHSLGALVCGHHPATAHILVSSVSDGEKSFDYDWTPEQIQTWETQGYIERGRGDGYHRLAWSHYEDRCSWSLLDSSAPKLSRVLLISGTEDGDRPGTDDLEQTIQSRRRYATDVTRLDVEGAGHSIRDSEHLEQVKEAIVAFIAKL